MKRLIGWVFGLIVRVVTAAITWMVIIEVQQAYFRWRANLDLSALVTQFRKDDQGDTGKPIVQRYDRPITPHEKGLGSGHADTYTGVEVQAHLGSPLHGSPAANALPLAGVHDYHRRIHEAAQAVAAPVAPSPEPDEPKTN